jgi:hypothetical protein
MQIRFQGFGGTGTNRLALGHAWISQPTRVQPLWPILWLQNWRIRVSTGLGRWSYYCGILPMRCGNIEMLFYIIMSWKPRGRYVMLILMMRSPNCMLTLRLTMWQIGGILICLWQYTSKSPFDPIDNGLLTQNCWSRSRILKSILVRCNCSCTIPLYLQTGQWPNAPWGHSALFLNMFKPP